MCQHEAFIYLVHILALCYVQTMVQNNQMSCPICMKSYMNMDADWRRLDAEIAVTPMPQDYANWRVDVLCNDCNKPSKVQFHILGLKCSHCRSYNTRRIRLEQNQLLLGANLAGAAATVPQPEAEQTTADDASSEPDADQQ